MLLENSNLFNLIINWSQVYLILEINNIFKVLILMHTINQILLYDTYLQFI